MTTAQYQTVSYALAIALLVAMVGIPFIFLYWNRRSVSKFAGWKIGDRAWVVRGVAPKEFVVKNIVIWKGAFHRRVTDVMLFSPDKMTPAYESSRCFHTLDELIETLKRNAKPIK